MGMVFCRGCGKEIHETAITCPQCGAPQSSASLKRSIPDGIKGWSWGAFLLSFIWAICNRVWWGLLAIIPPISLIVAVILGIKGREFAWENGNWESVEHFQRVQKKWSQWALGILGLLIAGVVITVSNSAYNEYRTKAIAARLEAQSARWSPEIYPILSKVSGIWDTEHHDNLVIIDLVNDKKIDAYPVQVTDINLENKTISLNVEKLGEIHHWLIQEKINSDGSLSLVLTSDDGTQQNLSFFSKR